MTRRLLPSGPRAWLVELPAGDVVAFAGTVREVGDPAIVDVVPAASTVLVTLADRDERERLGEWLRTLPPSKSTDIDNGPLVDVAVRYDGDDLADVATACGLSVEDVVARHTDATYRCAFCGFAPGFGYLTGLDPALHLPRRATPRTRVPSGSVAIAAEYTAVYPSPSPGGWHLIGRTDAPMWDATRRPPALIRAGTRVRFVRR